MSFSNQEFPATPDLLNPTHSSTLRWHDAASPIFDRSIIGIPPEDDEFTRGMIFFVDPSTGQPSVPSTSQESGYPDDNPPDEPSPSMSSRRIFTPRSVSDASGSLGPQNASSRSVGSPGDRSSILEADGRQTPSVSAGASAGTSEVGPSPISTQTDTYVPSGSHIAITMSSTLDQSIPEGSGPLEGTGYPQKIISLNQNDFGYLQDIMSLDDPNRTEHPSPPIVLVDNQISQRVTPPHSELARGSKTEDDEVHRGMVVGTRAVARGTQRLRRPGPYPTVRPGYTKDASEKPKSKKEIRNCLRCLVNHEQCDPDPGNICSKCRNAKIQKMPCIRLRLIDADLYRKGALSFPDGPPTPPWASRINIPLTLYHFGPANASDPPESRPSFKVVCRKYQPTAGACISKSWIKGTERVEISLPPFAIPPHKDLDPVKSLDIFLAAGYTKLVGELAVGQDDIIALTLQEAARQAERCKIIKDALTLAVLSRLASKSFNIIGEQTLGIAQEQDPDCPYYQRIPIPPLMDAQIDSLLMAKMETLKKKVLSELRVMIVEHGRKRWFKIYLTISVLLVNLESIYQNQCRQIERYNQHTPQQATMLESWEHSAKNLLAHFCAVCRGDIPLNREWSKEDQAAAELDDQGMKFIAHLITMAKSRAEFLRETSNAPLGTPLKWISALFVPENGV